MFPRQATAVIEAVKAAPENESLLGRWSDDEEGYPPEMLKAILFTTNQHAVEWIDANLPKAWFRPVFAGK